MPQAMTAYPLSLQPSVVEILVHNAQAVVVHQCENCFVALVVSDVQQLLKASQRQEFYLNGLCVITMSFRPTGEIPQQADANSRLIGKFKTCLGQNT